MTTGPWGSEDGVDDDTFVRRLRELLGDWPVMTDEQFSPTGTATKFVATKLPINDDKYVTVTVNGTPVPIVASRTGIPGGSVYVDYDSGLLIFGSAPPTGTNTVVISKSKVRWRDSVMLSALYGGLRALWPKCFKECVDIGTQMHVNQWDFAMPADFWDARVMIQRTSMRDIPAQTNVFREISGVSRVGLDTVRIPRSQRWSPTSTLEVQYSAPYRSLSELAPAEYDLPLWYAASQLLGFGEAKRTLVDNQTVASSTSANPPASQQNAGAWYMSRFNQLLASLGRPMGMARPISTYSR